MTRPFSRVAWFGMFCLVLMVVVGRAQTPSQADQDLWAGELKYWQFRTSGEIDRYMNLWHEEFVGWPLSEAQPLRYADLRNEVTSFVESTRPGSATFVLEPLSVRIYGTVGIVYYRVDTKLEDRSGNRIERRGRITHTWQKTNTGWKIIGGMSSWETLK